MEFEIPFRELGFHGVPHRSTAFVMPSVNCLVRAAAMSHPDDLILYTHPGNANAHFCWALTPKRLAFVCRMWEQVTSTQ